MVCILYVIADVSNFPTNGIDTIEVTKHSFDDTKDEDIEALEHYYDNEKNTLELAAMAYVQDEVIMELEQKFCTGIILTEVQFNLLKIKLVM